MDLARGSNLGIVIKQRDPLSVDMSARDFPPAMEVEGEDAEVEEEGEAEAADEEEHAEDAPDADVVVGAAASGGGDGVVGAGAVGGLIVGGGGGALAGAVGGGGDGVAMLWQGANYLMMTAAERVKALKEAEQRIKREMQANQIQQRKDDKKRQKLAARFRGINDEDFEWLAAERAQAKAKAKAKPKAAGKGGGKDKGGKDKDKGGKDTDGGVS